MGKVLQVSFISVITVLLILGSLGSAIAQSKSPRSPLDHRVIDLLTKEDGGIKGVWVEAIYMTREYFKAVGFPDGAKKYDLDKYLAFRINIDTHQGDIMVYKMGEITYLRGSDGKEYPAVDWEDLSRGSHHRSGVVRFSRVDEKGNPILASGTKSLEVVVKGVADVKERVFRWEFPIKFPGG